MQSGKDVFSSTNITQVFRKMLSAAFFIWSYFLHFLPYDIGCTPTIGFDLFKDRVSKIR
jgi:hypothetical protein